MDKVKLKSIMKEHGDKSKDLAAAIDISPANLSAAMNGRWELGLKYIRRIGQRYDMSPQQICEVFIFPE